jgi:hypothetical protein
MAVLTLLGSLRESLKSLEAYYRREKFRIVVSCKQPSPWSTAPNEKLGSRSASQEIPRILWSSDVCYFVRKSPTFVFEGSRVPISARRPATLTNVVFSVPPGKFRYNTLN